MTSSWQHYHTPSSVEDALRLMAGYGDEARLIAGGTDLILDLRDRADHGLTALVDVTHIHGLNTIREEDDQIVVGAAVTHTQIERSDLLRRHGLALVEGCRVVGGPQVRNVATLGGNIAHALPAADGAIGLLALDAQVQISTLEGAELHQAWVPLLDIYAGPGRNTLTPNQMLTAFRFGRADTDAARAHSASAFDRIMRPQGVALPILGVAARLGVDSQGCIIQATLAVGPAGPIPFRANKAEAELRGVKITDTAAMTQAIEAAVAAAQAEAQLRTSRHRASKEYRHEMLAVLLRRVLTRAAERVKAAL